MFKGFSRVALSLATVSVLLLSVLLGAKAKPVESYEIVVSDRGINQWNQNLREFQPFTEGGVKSHVVPGLSAQGQILIPMRDDSHRPRSAAGRQMYVQELAGRFVEELRSRAPETGGKFEIQLVQNINTVGYVDGERQKACSEFAADVYRALGIAKGVLAQEARIRMDAVMGSNGGHVFTEVVPTLPIVPFDTAILVSPRAFVADTRRTYFAMNGRLAIVNETGDIPAFPWMVANHDVARQLKSECPKLLVILADPLDGVFAGGSLFGAHTATMAHGSGLLGAKEWTGSQYVELKARGGYDMLERTRHSWGPSSDTGRDDLGGVDFGSLRLDFVGNPSSTAVPPHLFAAYLQDGIADAGKLAAAKGLAVQAFNSGLALRPDQLWVNLNPTEPERVIDPETAQTDVGRIMLEADLQLKKDAARLKHPEGSPVGRAYWERIRASASGPGSEDGIETQTRVWIVPGEVRLVSTSGGVRVALAELRVQLEVEGQRKVGVDEQSVGLSDADRAAKELVLPPLQDAVNRGSQYESLRVVFRSLVLARWYQRACRQNGVACPGEFPGAGVSEEMSTWTPEATWEGYTKSLRDGEFRFVERKSTVSGNVETTVVSEYASGGVDFTSVELPVPTGDNDEAVDAAIGAALARAGGAVVGQVAWFRDAPSRDPLRIVPRMPEMVTSTKPSPAGRIGPSGRGCSCSAPGAAN